MVSRVNHSFSDCVSFTNSFVNWYDTLKIERKQFCSILLLHLCLTYVSNYVHQTYPFFLSQSRFLILIRVRGGVLPYCSNLLSNSSVDVTISVPFSTSNEATESGEIFFFRYSTLLKWKKWQCHQSSQNYFEHINLKFNTVIPDRYWSTSHWKELLEHRRSRSIKKTVSTLDNHNRSPNPWHRNYFQNDNCRAVRYQTSTTIA